MEVIKHLRAVMGRLLRSALEEHVHRPTMEEELLSHLGYLAQYPDWTVVHLGGVLINGSLLRAGWKSLHYQLEELGALQERKKNRRWYQHG